MKELDKLFQRNADGTDILPKTGNAKTFFDIFDKLDYIGHQATNKNDIFWLFRNGARQEVEIKGINDHSGNYGYIRYRNRTESMRYDGTDKAGNRKLIEARFVGIVGCQNLIEVNDFVSWMFQISSGFEVVKDNLNTLQVHQEEVGTEHKLRKDIEKRFRFVFN
jgi:hypothetical protein